MNVNMYEYEELSLEETKDVIRSRHGCIGLNRDEAVEDFMKSLDIGSLVYVGSRYIKVKEYFKPLSLDLIDEC